MRILLINHYAGSPMHGMEYRPYYLAREWVRLGHQVKIIASSESHVRSRQPHLASLDRLDETIDGIEYTWFETPRYAGNSIGRVRNMACFISRLYREGKALTQSFNPDIVIASSTYPMDIWSAHRIARLAKAKLVFEVHDLWPLSPMELGGMSKWHPFIMVVRAAEAYAYQNADVVISILPKVREYMESRGMAPHKLHIVPNGIDPAEWHVDSLDLKGTVREALSNLKAEGRSIVGYAGSHGVANSLITLIDAAKLMEDENVVFVLIGDGPDKRVHQRHAEREGLKNIWFMDPVQKQQIPSLLEWFDLLYLGSPRQPLYRFGISPNKLMDYMMAGRPVLMAIDAGNDPVEEAGCGISVEPDDPQAVARGVRRLLALPSEELTAMGQRGHAYVLKHHSYPVLAQQFFDSIRF